MISVCIPIYNYYAYPLVRRLVNQRDSLKDPSQVEIVCIDDHSSGFYLNQNMGIVEIAQYLRLNENIGRARIRNLFLKYTQGEWLLFLNDDAQIPDNFLQKYLKQVNGKADVVVGGRRFEPGDGDTEHKLRFLYAQQFEFLSSEERASNPYRFFMPGNAMIRRSLLENLRFDPRYDGYDHDGAFFGYQLGNRKVPVLHISNEVTNGYIETNAEYLHDTVDTLEKLVKVYDVMWEDPRFCRGVPVLDCYARLRRMRLIGFAYLIFKMFRSPMESHFVVGHGISMLQFKFYKLGIFIEKMKEAEKNLRAK